MNDWAQVELPQGTTLMLGRKRGANLEVRSLRVTRDLAAALREVAQGTLEAAATRRAKAWESLATLEEDEAFTISTEALPAREIPQRRTASYRATLAPAGDEVPDAIARASALGLLLDNPSYAETLTVDEAQRYRFKFYAAVFGQPGNSVAFVKKHNPLHLMQGQQKFLGTYSNDTADIFDGSVLSFADNFDLVIDGDDMIALNDVVKDLFLDLDLMAAASPVIIAKAAGLSNLRLTSAAIEALQAAITTRRTLARRLLTIVNDKATAKLTPAELSAYLATQQIESAPFVVNGDITCAAETAEELIDHLGALRRRNPYSGQLQRIDRGSTISEG